MMYKEMKIEGPNYFLNKCLNIYKLYFNETHFNLYRCLLSHCAGVIDEEKPQLWVHEPDSGGLQTPWNYLENITHVRIFPG